MGGDALLTMLENNWQPYGVVFRQEVWLGGCRRVFIYHVSLYRHTETLQVAVIDNPHMGRIIASFDAQLVRLNEYINLEMRNRNTSLSQQHDRVS